jgi:hypothetical protein
MHTGRTAQEILDEYKRQVFLPFRLSICNHYYLGSAFSQFLGPHDY